MSGEMPQVRCPDCGALVDKRSHNLRAHRKTHGANGSKPLRIPDLFELTPAGPGIARESPMPLERETFKLTQ